ncbi:MAG: DUF2442 domain-containing protein [Clostridia bacterium]
MKKTIEFYISKGFDKKMAEYFANGRRTITAVVPNDDFTLTLSFDNGERRIFDVSPFLKPGTVFETFKNLDNFKRVYLDEDGAVAWDIDPNVDSSTHWMNKVDLCPDTCYVDSVPLSGGVLSV